MSREHLNIMVLEDEPSLRELMYEMLKQNYQEDIVMSTDKPEIALIYPADLYFLDYNLKGKSVKGSDVASVLRTQDRDIFLVHYSSVALNDLKDKESNLYDSCLPKPFSYELLCELVDFARATLKPNDSLEDIMIRR